MHTFLRPARARLRARCGDGRPCVAVASWVGDGQGFVGPPWAAVRPPVLRPRQRRPSRQEPPRPGRRRRLPHPAPRYVRVRVWVQIAPIGLLSGAMTNHVGGELLHDEEAIIRLLAPLAQTPGAFALEDDCAVLKPPARH